ncbi:molybdopterin/thiamine biosynthesis adenylyltransferase [Microbacterium sp. SORGH_AS 1204]|uniref:ThiF family adenylyltransferase n=1 Tax=Microbacterium sp. SORGH_AS_1204 TaxID=3041785 RepID=UPI00278E1B50|nr:ThiF family adenylyltransferase [Microbacterium sp. SORGH_AS_1204]MDQ1138454.1 molybdopterin/thiamine biosynthesis adenylyltransferase [Microbacterium sp. SORGH_AS_1204]
MTREQAAQQIPVPPEFRRNLGFWRRSEQQLLQDSTIAIAGAGGDGFDLAVALVMMAGPKEIRIADPETFVPENSNRVAWANSDTYGRLKVEALRETINKIRPETRVVTYPDGVTVDNADEFVAGADLVLDESELHYLHVGTALARAARRHRVPNLLVMNIGFGAIATSFAPSSRYTFERVMGLPPDITLEEAATRTADLSRCVPYVPSYGDLATFRATVAGAPLPSVVQGVKAAVSLGATEALLHLTRRDGNRRRSPVFAPHWAYSDPMTLASGRMRYARAHHWVRAAVLASRSLLGWNPRASYAEEVPTAAH